MARFSMHMLANVSMCRHNLFMAPKEFLALRMLITSPHGMYGSEFVQVSNGKLPRASVYTVLSRLVDKGFVVEEEDPPTKQYALARTRHKITAEGARAFHAECADFGLMIDQDAFAGAA